MWKGGEGNSTFLEVVLDFHRPPFDAREDLGGVGIVCVATMVVGPWRAMEGALSGQSELLFSHGHEMSSGQNTFLGGVRVGRYCQPSSADMSHVPSTPHFDFASQFTINVSGEELLAGNELTSKRPSPATAY
jgi:hypothetical protein